MPAIAKSLGQFLGTRNKMPKPLLGNVNIASIVKRAQQEGHDKEQGQEPSYNTLHSGHRGHGGSKIYDNVKEVLSAVTKKLGANHIRSAYVKLTMSKPLKVA